MTETYAVVLLKTLDYKEICDGSIKIQFVQEVKKRKKHLKSRVEEVWEV